MNGATAPINVRADFDPVVQSLAGGAYQVGRLAVACGHLGVVLILCKTGRFRFLTDPRPPGWQDQVLDLPPALSETGS